MGRKKKELKQLTQLPLTAISLGGGMSLKAYGKDKIAEMTRSLSSTGMRDPLLVKPLLRAGRYGLVIGGCRYHAAVQLGWKNADCLVLDNSLSEEIRVLEKLRTDDFTPWEMADALHRLKEQLDCTQTHLGQAVGRNRDFVTNLLALTQITPETREFIHSHQNGGRLTARHLRYVGRAAPSAQIRIARNILGKRVSTTELEKSQGGSEAKRPKIRFPGLRALRPAQEGESPRDLKEWKKYNRQLNTDLRRVDKQETEELRRTRRLIADARQRQQLVKQEAARKRRDLLRELRRSKRQIGQPR